MKIRNDQRGIAHHLLLVVIALLVVGSIGFAGYRVYKGKQIDASAAGYTYIGKVNPDGKGLVSFYGCKSVSGTTAQLKFFVKNQNQSYVYLEGRVTRIDAGGESGSVVDTQGANTNVRKRLERNVTTQPMLLLTASTASNDRYSISIGKSKNTGSYFPQGVLNWSVPFGQLLTTLGSC